ncbi:HAD family phosphatase [Microbacterium sp. T2.11-28]|uniref:HAD family hydrolase n=1 Tax=Microbacterium sp. T2.11-28 TaxID=3041169 RepID=UPI002477C33C|nr:HAD family phosphatase [Microbacterium sp. T2.11-28]CAI9390876.1 Phosphoglycolate phosphatase [Microbacterium sp. T2.11-28]
MTWPDAVLWDMDGTFIDSERAWLDGARTLAARSGVTLQRADLDRLVGASMATTAAVLQAAGVAGDADEIIAELTERVRIGLVDDLVFRPGALALAAEVAAAGIPQAIVSMSNRRIVDHVIAVAPVALASVAGDDVANGKPHPEAYLTAAARLGVAIERCIVLEDSATGLAAGVASGAVAVAVPFYLPVDASAAAAEWDALEGRTLTDLQRLAPRSSPPSIPSDDNTALLPTPTLITEER